MALLAIRHCFFKSDTKLPSDWKTSGINVASVLLFRYIFSIICGLQEFQRFFWKHLNCYQWLGANGSGILIKAEKTHFSLKCECWSIPLTVTSWFWKPKVKKRLNNPFSHDTRQTILCWRFRSLATHSEGLL